MSRTDRITTRDGKIWYVGAYIEWGNETDPACVMIPINQIEGLSDQELGRAVRESMDEARLCVVEHDAENFVKFYYQSASYRDMREMKPTLLEFVGRSPIIDKALEIIALKEARQLPRKPIQPTPRARSGHIYLVEGQNCYKIGKSVDVPTRAGAFTLQLPFPIQLIHSIPTSDMVWAEAYMHRTFAHCRMNGEWFDLSPDDVAWICDIESINPA